MLLLPLLFSCHIQQLLLFCHYCWLLLRQRVYYYAMPATLLITDAVSILSLATLRYCRRFITLAAIDIA